MKKLLSSFVVAASLSAFAAWERVGSLQVADMATQGAAVAKIGSFIGNPLAAAGMAAAIADSPLLKFFGPMRDKTPMSFALFLDCDALSKDPSDALGSLEFAVLYPVSISKDEFAKRHPGSYATNDMLVVKGDLFNGADSNKTTYVVFSDDGRWAGASDKVEQAKLALDEVAAAAKSMDGDVVRLRVDEKAFSAITAMAKTEDGIDAETVAMLESYKSVSLGLRVSDLGIDARAAVHFKEGSESSKCGLKQLGQSPFAFAGKDAIYANVQAEDAGSAGQLAEESWAQGVSLCKKHGLDILKFVSMDKSEKGFKLVFDVVALCKAVKDKDGAAFEKFDFDGFMKEAKKVKAAKKFTAKTPAYALAGVIKGFVPQWPVAERFAATLPEAATKKPYAESFFSISSMLKAIADESVAFVPEEQRAMMKPVLDQLANETKGGCACMFWRQGDAHRVFFRISADECRCFGGLAMAAMMFGTEGDSFSVDVDYDDDGDDDDN